MLKELQIRDFALIEQVDLTFYPGFTVLTGETGAGKSIIIDALGLLLGGRASTDVIRAGSDSTSIEGSFTCPPRASAMLEEWGIVPEHDEIIVSRDVSRNGRSRCRINGRMVTVSQLAALGVFLVDILGQHHQQTLLNSSHHLDLLDSFGDSRFHQLKGEMEQAFLQYQAVQQRLTQLQQDERERLRRMDLLQFQWNEIEEAHLRRGEEEELLQEEKELANADRMVQTLTEAYVLLQDGDGQQPSLLEQLSHLEGQLSSLEGLAGSLDSTIETFASGVVQMQEAARDLRRLADHYESNPERLNEVEERLQLFQELKRKYGDNLEEILIYGEQCREELEQLTGHSQTMKQLEKELVGHEERCRGLAATLRTGRLDLAETIRSKVESELAVLGMEKTTFRVSVTDRERGLGVHGSDSVEFLIAPNVGEDLKPLSRIASGGELSRIMLALKAILAARDGVPTLEFDEVDTGIGGRTAQAVAEKLRQVAQRAQVLCITHLPVIAGRADWQYAIEKNTNEQRTTVRVSALTTPERVEELTRMLGGTMADEAVQTHARRLLTGIADPS